MGIGKTQGRGANRNCDAGQPGGVADAAITQVALDQGE